MSRSLRRRPRSGAARARWLGALLAVSVAACNGEDPSTQPVPPTTTVAPDVDVAPETAQFLSRAAGAVAVAFTAEYAVLYKLGGRQTTVTVRSAPPASSVTAGDVVVFDGPHPASCDLAARSCVGWVEEQRLTAFGISSRFWATGPVDAITGMLRRSGGAPPVRSTRTAAGVALDCMAVPVEQALTAVHCITPEGVFGFVENPSVRYELVSYTLGPPSAPVEAPFPIQTPAEAAGD